MDISILLLNTHKANVQPDIGYQDTIETIEGVNKRLNQKVLVDPRLIESMLWACNMLNEDGKFIHPTNLTLDEFIKVVLPNGTFDLNYNTIKWNDGDNDE